MVSRKSMFYLSIIVIKYNKPLRVDWNLEYRCTVLTDNNRSCREAVGWEATSDQ
jgi:hypothetical protein